MQSKKSLEEIKSKLAEMDVLLKSLEDGLLKVEAFEKELDEINATAVKLQTYYHKDWDADVTKLHQEDPNTHFNCSNQDSIWNATQDLYALKIRLLKKIIQSI